MAEKQFSKLFTFFSLYIAQSVPMSLFSTLLPVLMRQDNFSLTAIGMLQFIKLPWIVKFLWAPLVDRKTSGLNTYKSWIFSSEIVYAFLILMLASLDLKADFWLVLTLIILSFIASGTQDIATDAMTALSLVFPIQNVVNSVAVGFGIGINVMIAFCLGADQREQADKAASQGMFLSIVHGIILSITGILIMPSFLKLLTGAFMSLFLGVAAGAAIAAPSPYTLRFGRIVYEAFAVMRCVRTAVFAMGSIAFTR